MRDGKVRRLRFFTDAEAALANRPAGRADA
jgi:hypothetical protein